MPKRKILLSINTNHPPSPLKKRASTAVIGGFFEKSFRSYCQWHQISCIKIPNGAKFLGPGKIIPVKSPFDFVCGRKKIIYFFDTKTCAVSRFPVDKITPHQVDALQMMEEEGQRAGYLVEMRKHKKVVFFRASLLRAHLGRDSLGLEDGVIVGDSDLQLSIDFDLIT